MQNAENRELREKLMKARSSQCFGEDKNNNENLILEIVATRTERAKLLGFQNHADYVLKNRMALNETTVMNFLQELTEKSLTAAKRETEELINFATQNGFNGEFQKWDVAFWSEKLKKAKLDIDDEVLRLF